MVSPFLLTMAAIKKIQWTEPRKANNQVRYDHVIGKTPIGDILITWKSWKSNDDYCVDESPWYALEAYGFMVSASLEELKAQCQSAFEKYVDSCFE